MSSRLQQNKLLILSLATLSTIGICALLYYFSPMRHDISREKASELGRQYATQECNEMVQAGSEYDCSNIVYGAMKREPGSPYDNWVMNYSVKSKISEKRYDYSVNLTRFGERILPNGNVVR